MWLAGAAPRPRPSSAPRWLDAVPCQGRWCVLAGERRVCEREAPDQPGEGRCANLDENGAAIAWDAGRQLLWVLDTSGGLRGLSPARGWIPAEALAPPPRSPSFLAFSVLAVEGNRAVALDTVGAMMGVFDLGTSPPRRRATFFLQARPSSAVIRHGVALVAEPSTAVHEPGGRWRTSTLSAGLQLVDLTDADHPRELAWLPLDPGPQAVAVDEDLVALACGEGGVSTWRWDGKATLHPVWRADTTGLASGAAFAGGALWIADGASLLRFPGRGAAR
ncbi:MAG TPA: hypothetical protein VND93_18665 [Myxococcales bacterium]|nr:hypothetical protein [Myxococcales bacterium]